MPKGRRAEKVAVLQCVTDIRGKSCSVAKIHALPEKQKLKFDSWRK